VVSPLDAEPAATRQRGEGRGRARTDEGATLNKLDNQTAVHDREPSMLYRKMRNKSMKRETTEGGRQETGYMYNDEQKQRHRTQGSSIRRSMKKEENKGEKRNGHELRCETRTNEPETARHDDEDAICNFALGDRLERGGPGRVSRAGADDRTASVMKNSVHY
jgi:hypothetical protein